MKLKPFNKPQQRILLSRLENFYAHQLINWQSFKSSTVVEKRAETRKKSVDRRYRVLFKAIEVVLHKLGSKLFEDGEKPPSIRKTKTVKAGNLSVKVLNRSNFGREH